VTSLPELDIVYEIKHENKSLQTSLWHGEYMYGA